MTFEAPPPQMKRADAERLFNAINNGTPKQAAAARSEVCLRVERLVWWVAYKYKDYGVPLEDLVQEGQLGVLTAIDKFEYKRGHMFSTYAVHWIRAKVQRAAERQGRIVPLPTAVTNHIRMVSKFQRAFEDEHRRMPTLDEIVEGTNLCKESVRFALKRKAYELSLDEPVYQGEDGERSSMVDNMRTADPFQVNEEQREADARAEAERVLDLLDDARERLIVEARNGIGVPDVQTLEELAKRLGISKERVRQIENVAMAKLIERGGQLPVRLQLNTPLTNEDVRAIL